MRYTCRFRTCIILQHSIALVEVAKSLVSLKTWQSTVPEASAKVDTWHTPSHIYSAMLNVRCQLNVNGGIVHDE